ncbi:MAG: hypothetical protein C4K60_06450 [Ideonella sp. MAG2]|nr:MAG: hypothetical protein C4K60_06450 [Ideonella sp. MAG2]
MPHMQPSFVLFSGHNDRAVVALCRFFTRQALPFVIVAAGPQDAIWRTAFAPQVVLSRLDKRLDVDLFQAAVQASQQPELVYCPTTEFMNQFVLEQREALQARGLRVGLPSKAVYAQLTSKLHSAPVVQKLTGISPPPDMAWAQLQAPCVLKPRHNVQGGQVLYPQLCRTEAQLQAARAGLDPAQWFAQAWVEGQSHYLCAYLARNGEHAHFWQDNLLQQPEGKSMVLARSGSNPGVDTDRLFQGLHALGFHGPFMMELISDAQGQLHYIEINPRFWGPLQLALSACPRLLTLFARDHGATVPEPVPASAGPHWYAWAQGARQGVCRRYPRAEGLPADELLQQHDVYGAPDTQALHACH